MISVGDLRPGITFEYEGNLYVVLDYSHNKTARAAANIKVKMKNMRSGATTEITFGGNDKVKKAHIDKRKMQYLYNSGDALVFMDNETYEQIEIPAGNLEWEMNFLKESDEVEVTILYIRLQVNWLHCLKILFINTVDLNTVFTALMNCLNICPFMINIRKLK